MLFETLNLFPVNKIEEEWQWQTDILRAKNGSESRISLRDYPRLTMKTDLFLGNDVQNRAYYNYLRNSAKAVHYVPMWQNAVQPSQNSDALDSKLFFTTEYTSYVPGMIITLLNLQDVTVKNYIVDTVDSDGINLTTPLQEDVNSRFLIMPAIAGYIETNSGISLNPQVNTGQVQITAIEEPDFLYPDDNYTLTTLEGSPVMTEIFSEGSDGMEFEYSIIDNKTGVRGFETQWDTVHLGGDRKFLIHKYDNQQMSFWRTFLDTVKGSWKSFFMSSQKSDFIKIEGFEFSALPEEDFLIVQLGTEFTDETYSFIAVQYTDGSFSYHRVVEDVPYIVNAEPVVNTFSNNERYLNLLDVPGVTAELIDAGLVSFRLYTDITATYRAVAFPLVGPAPFTETLTIQDKNSVFNDRTGTGTQGSSQRNVVDPNFGGPHTYEKVLTPNTRYVEYKVEAGITGAKDYVINEFYCEVVIDGDPINVVNNYDYRRLTIDPPLPDDPKVGVELANDGNVGSIPKISQLLKCRMGDSVSVTHGSLDAVLSMTYITTNEG